MTILTSERPYGPYTMGDRVGAVAVMEQEHHEPARSPMLHHNEHPHGHHAHHLAAQHQQQQQEYYDEYHNNSSAAAAAGMQYLDHSSTNLHLGAYSAPLVQTGKKHYEKSIKTNILS